MKNLLSYEEQLAAAEAQIIGVSASFAAAPKAGSNPYAVLALFDASFATFSSDYADAIAALEASLADLKAAKTAIKSAKTASEKEAAGKVADAAATRAEATATFAKNVADRESTAAKAQEKFAAVMGVEIKGASADAIAAALTKKVIAETGMSADEVAFAAKEPAKASAYIAKVSKSVAAKLEGKAELAQELKAAQKEAVKAEANALKGDYAAQKAKAQLAQKAAELKIAAAKADDATKAALEKQADDAAKAVENNDALVKATAEVTKKADEMKAAATEAAAKAEELAKKSEEDIAKAVAEAQKAAEEAKKAEEAAKAEAEANKANVAIEDVAGFSKIYMSVANYDSVAKAGDAYKDTAAVKDAIANLAGADLASKIASADGYEFSFDVAKSVLSITEGLGFTLGGIAAGDKLSAVGALIEKINKGGTSLTAADLADKTLNGMKLANDNNLLKITFKVGNKEKTISVKHFESKEALKALAGISASTTLEAMQNKIDVRKVGTKDVKEFADGAYLVIEDAASGAHLIDFNASKGATLEQYIALQEADDNGKVIAALKKFSEVSSVVATITNSESSNDLTSVSNYSDINQAGKITMLKDSAASPSATIIAVLKQTADNVFTLIGKDFAIEGVKGATTQQALAGLASSPKLKDVQSAAGATAAGNTVSFTVYDGDKATKVSVKTGDSADKSTVTADGVTFTLADTATLGDIAQLGDAALFSDVANSLKAIGDIAVDSGAIKMSATGKKLTLDGYTTIAKIKGLSKTSMLKQLVDAGVTKIDNCDVREEGGEYLIEYSGTIYRAGEATLENLEKLVGGSLGDATAQKNAKIYAAVATDKYLNKVGTDLAKTLLEKPVGDSFVLYDNDSDQNKKGTLTKTGADELKWENADSSIKFIANADAKLNDIVAVDGSMKCSVAAKVVADGEDITVSGTVIDLAKVPVAKETAQTYTLTALQTYLAEPTPMHSNLTTLVGTSEIPLYKGGVKVGTLTNAKYVSADGLEISALKTASAKVSDILSLSKASNWKTISGVIADSANIKIDGTKEFTYASETLKLKVGGASIIVDAGNDTVLSNVAAPAGVESKGSALTFDFGTDDADHTLDLTGFKGDSSGVAIGAKDGNTVKAANQTIAIKMTAGTDIFEITTPELKGDGADDKMITFDLTGFGADDKLVLTFGANLAGLTGDQTINSVAALGGANISAQHNTDATKMVKISLSAGTIGDDNIKTIAKELDKGSDTGGANVVYYHRTDSGDVYLINTNADQSGGSDDKTDATIIKLKGLNQATVEDFVDKVINIAATITIEGQA